MRRLYLYSRGPRPTWYIGGFPAGKKQRSTGLFGHEARRLAEKSLINEQVKLDALAAKDGPVGPLTVSRWATKWIEGLRADGKPAADKYAGLMEQHVLPIIGRVVLVDVGEEHIASVLRHTAATRAQRTRLQIFTVMKQMFRRAVPKHIPHNPCLLIESGHVLMPKNVDKDPLFRKLARFSVEEVTMLVFDERVPEDRRMFYAIAFCTGMRSGEISALRFEVYDPAVKPLGELMVAYSYKADRRETKDTKTGGVRTVPVIPVLAELLAEWSRPGGGWSRLTGKEAPASQDLVLPTGPLGKRPNRNTHTTLELFHDDLRRLGLRRRRFHFSRHAFIRLCVNEGASKDILKWVTHGRPKEDAFDDYSEPPWREMCKHASLFPLVRPAPQAEAVPVRKYANSGSRHLQVTDTSSQVAKDTGEKCRTARSAKSHDEVVPAGTSRHLGGNPCGLEPPPPPASSPQDENGPHICRAVSASAKALTALEAGDVEGAKAILRGVSR